MRVKNAELEIIQGDITEIPVDAIVNPAHPSFFMAAGLSAIIKKKGGDEIESEVQQARPEDSGRARVTTAGKLPAKKIIHAVTGDENGVVDQVTIRHATAAALDCAARQGLTSLAIPALGCGVGDFSPQGAAKIMAQEVLKFLKTNESSLKKIIFCLFAEDVFETFDQTVRGYVTHIQDTLGDGPYVTVDIIIEVPDGIVLIERSNPPYGWALPGGFVDYGESLEESARREAKEETALDIENVRQFHTYSDPGRDPRFHTVSTVFVATGVGTPQSGSDAQNLKIVPYKELLNQEYAFDHKEIICGYLKERGLGK